MLISTFVKEIQIQSCTNTPLCTYREATVHIYEFVGNLETVSDGLTAIFCTVLAPTYCTTCPYMHMYLVAKI